jgi:hypothetical protein
LADERQAHAGMRRIITELERPVMTKDVIVDAEWDEIPDRDSGVNANARNTASRPPNEQPRSKSSDAADAITPLTQSRTMGVEKVDTLLRDCSRSSSHF